MHAPGLVVHRGPALDLLADVVVRELAHDPPADPFTAIRIAVPSSAVARWLTHRIARATGPDGDGIATGLHLPLVDAVVDEVVRRVVDDDGSVARAWAPSRLVWTLVACLGDTDARSVRLPAALRIAPDRPVDRRTWELARGVAGTFARYAAHLPDLARAWTDGRDVGPDGTALPAAQRWQPALWRAACARAGDPVARVDRAVVRLRGADPLDAASRAAVEDLTVLGVRTLAPRTAQVLEALAVRTRVRLLVVTASPARWSTDPLGPARHPLVAASARAADRTARQLAAAVAEHTEHTEQAEPTEHAEPPTAGRLLDVLRAGVRADAPLPPGPPTLLLAPDDDSVEVHVCHGLARQAEVLRDRLLALLDAHPDLEPRDVVVVTPDVEAAAAVLGPAFAGAPERSRLPWTVADRRLDAANPVADALLAVLAAVPGRVAATEVLDLLRRDPVARRFDLSATDLAVVTGWVEALGVRWGIDADHRAAHGQPRDRAHTWRAGLDRLLVGVAVDDVEDRVVGDVAPLPVWGDDVELAGRFVEACLALFAVLADLATPRSGTAWAADLADAVVRLVAVDEPQAGTVRDVLAVVREELADVVTALDVGTVLAVLARRLAEPRGAAAFETGVVTVCRPGSLAPVPARVVCLLGVDDGTLPRSAPTASHDLSAGRDDVTDPREVDRLDLLDAVLGARDHLVVTFTGRDARTDEPLPPAVPVQELLDAIGRIVGETERDARVVRTHPLQPWSPAAYRAADGEASFDPTWVEAARAVHAAGPGRAGWRDHFLVGWPPTADAMVEDDLVPRELTIDALVATLTAPMRAFARGTLGVRLADEAAVDDEVPLTLDALAQHRLVTELLARGSAAFPTWSRAATARQTVPAGTPGRLALAGVRSRVEAIESAERDWLATRDADVDAPTRTVDVDLRVAEGGRRLVGSLAVVDTPSGTVRVERTASEVVRPRALIGAWVRHLAATVTLGAPVTSALAGRHDAGAALVVLGPVAIDDGKAWRLLDDLVALDALARTTPTPLFLRTAHALRTAPRPRQAARSAFEGSAHAPGDRDAWTELVVGPVDLDTALVALGGWERLAELADRLWGPLLAHREVVP